MASSPPCPVIYPVTHDCGCLDVMDDTAELGRYADHRTYPLPRGWTPVSTDTLELAAEQAVQALETPAAVDRLLGYYDPASDYAGTTFLDVRPNDPDTVGAADLWAV